MVAGSPPHAGLAVSGAATAAGPPRAVVWEAAWLRHRTLFVCATLYALAVVLLVLPVPFGQHPAWAYNWEGYTAWRWLTFWAGPERTLGIVAPTDGLMTDSGQGLLLGLPLTLSIALGGFTLEALRLPAMLLSACAVPLLWLCGRRMIGSGPALLAAMLLAISPVFLFYGRTATLVGVSLLPLLLTVLALLAMLEAPTTAAGWRWRREGLLVAVMLLGLISYAPVRLLWPVTVVLLGVAAVVVPARRRVLLLTSLACLGIVPLTVMALDALAMPDPDPPVAALSYFHARGEQLTAMSDDPTLVGRYVRDATAPADPWAAARLLVTQNAGDLLRLLRDDGTRPVLTDYWNETGKFWPGVLLPFALLGALACLAPVRRSGRRALTRALPLLLFLALTLPLLLTSRVHIGRLLPALPFALLLVSLGVVVAAVQGGALLRRLRVPVSPALLGSVLALALLAAAAVQTRQALAVPLSPTREEQITRALAAWAGSAELHGGAVLVDDPAIGDEIERVHAATYELGLDSVYQFSDLRHPAASPDARPQLLWRGALPALQAGQIAEPCARLWFVMPEAIDAFVDAWRDAGCTGAPDAVALP
ncbi:MAG: glycosyltransferase family 39 protein [Thermomicrobiales bacterium]